MKIPSNLLHLLYALDMLENSQFVHQGAQRATLTTALSLHASGKQSNSAAFNSELV